MNLNISIDSKADTWIETYTGKEVDPFDLKEEEVDIEDIAHALSMLCRFNGHCHSFYSVAEHSVRVCNHFTSLNERYEQLPKVQMYALLHDAAEAYLGDFPSPIKNGLPKEVKEVEKKVSDTIFKAYGISDRMIEKSVVSFSGQNIKKDVKHSDLVLLVTEARDLGLNPKENWAVNEMVQPLDRRIVPYSSQDAKRLFLDKFYDLYES